MLNLNQLCVFVCCVPMEQALHFLQRQKAVLNIGILNWWGVCTFKNKKQKKKTPAVKVLLGGILHEKKNRQKAFKALRFL